METGEYWQTDYERTKHRKMQGLMKQAQKSAEKQNQKLQEFVPDKVPNNTDSRRIIKDAKGGNQKMQEIVASLKEKTATGKYPDKTNIKSLDAISFITPEAKQVVLTKASCNTTAPRSKRLQAELASTGIDVAPEAQHSKPSLVDEHGLTRFTGNQGFKRRKISSKKKLRNEFQSKT